MGRSWRSVVVALGIGLLAVDLRATDSTPSGSSSSGAWPLGTVHDGGVTRVELPPEAGPAPAKSTAEGSRPERPPPPEIGCGLDPDQSTNDSHGLSWLSLVAVALFGRATARRRS